MLIQHSFISLFIYHFQLVRLVLLLPCSKVISLKTMTMGLSDSENCVTLALL